MTKSRKEGGKKGRRKKMIEDKATERWKERARKLGLIVNAGADKFKPTAGPAPKAPADSSKVKLKKGKK
jgi:hypothetical protein